MNEILDISDKFYGLSRDGQLCWGLTLLLERFEQALEILGCN